MLLCVDSLTQRKAAFSQIPLRCRPSEFDMLTTWVCLCLNVCLGDLRVSARVA
jgi:hypothetical protein